MANKKISELTGLTTPASGDLFPVTDISDTITSGSPSGTTKRVTLSNLMAQAPVQSVAGKTGVVSLANADVSGSASSVSLATDKSALQGLINLRATQVSLASDKATLNGLINLRATQVSLFNEKTTLEGLINLRATQVSLGTLSSSLGTASTKDAGILANNVVQLNSSAQLPAVDGSNLTGISSAVEGSAVLSTGETGGTKYLREDGDNSSSWQPLVVGDEELRGTTNPHIGAFPNQSLKVLSSNPSGSALMVADATGLRFAVGANANVFVVKGTALPSRLAEASELPAFVFSKDTGEPDIELTDTDGEVYSLVSGDSDSLGANGLPARQGYQNPNIGGNPSPLLISGGTIS